MADLRTSVAFAPDAVKRSAVTASLLFQLGVPDTGLALANSLIKQRSPTNAPCIDTYFARALCHVALEGYQLALNDTNVISRLRPDNLLAFSLRAVCLFQLGKRDMALKQIRHFLEMKKRAMHDEPKPDQAALMADLTSVQLLQKDFAMAVCEVWCWQR